MPNNGGMAVWSTTANMNASIDSTVGFSEGQSPSSLNDGCRALMASAAKWRIDTGASIVTTGAATAYQVSSNQQFLQTSDMANNVIAFVPHVTNSSPVTLNVDNLLLAPLRSAPNTEILPGTLLAGSPYLATFNATDGAWYLHSFYGNPYNIPLGGLLESTVATPPNSSFVIPNGQAISRVTYAAYFALVGTTYGPGDGSTSYNIINLQGRVTAMMEATPTLLTSAFFGGNSSVIGATGGAQSEALSSTNQLPRFTPAGSVAAPLINGGTGLGILSGTGQHPIQSGSGDTEFAPGSFANLTANAPAFTGTAIGSTSPTAFATVQPTAIVQKFLRVL